MSGQQENQKRANFSGQMLNYKMNVTTAKFFTPRKRMENETHQLTAKSECTTENLSKRESRRYTYRETSFKCSA
jgi:hypothetical protein